jgi:hypothetical protein
MSTGIIRSGRSPRSASAWLAGSGRADEAEPLLAEARVLSEKMGATLWLKRLDALD